MFLPPVGDSSMLRNEVAALEEQIDVSTPCRGFIHAENISKDVEKIAYVSTPCRGFIHAEIEASSDEEDSVGFYPLSGIHPC